MLAFMQVRSKVVFVLFFFALVCTGLCASLPLALALAFAPATPRYMRKNVLALAGPILETVSEG